MQVHLAVLLPPAVAVPVASAVAAAVEPHPVAPSHPRRRLFGRSRAVSPPSASSEAAVAAVPADQLHIRVAAFGNMPTGDVHRLGDVLEEAAAQWQAPSVHVAGAGVQEGEVVALDLAGDVDALRGVARGVSTTVEGLRIFVDRRRFHPAVVVARARPLAEAEADLLRVADALRDHRGASWTIQHLSLVRLESDGGADRLVEFRKLPLGGTA